MTSNIAQTDGIDTTTISAQNFRALFVAVPFFACSIIPNLLFGPTLGQWGTNLIWGNLFGLGWCVAAYVDGGLAFNRFAAGIGFLAWPAVVLVGLYLASGWLYRMGDGRYRRGALQFLALSCLVNVPASGMMWIDRHIHLPDFSMHLANSY